MVLRIMHKLLTLQSITFHRTKLLIPLFKDDTYPNGILKSHFQEGETPQVLIDNRRKIPNIYIQNFDLSSFSPDQLKLQLKDYVLSNTFIDLACVQGRQKGREFEKRAKTTWQKESKQTNKQLNHSRSHAILTKYFQAHP